jgi:hypothetical protein
MQGILRSRTSLTSGATFPPDCASAGADPHAEARDELSDLSADEEAAGMVPGSAPRQSRRRRPLLFLVRITIVNAKDILASCKVDPWVVFFLFFFHGFS